MEPGVVKRFLGIDLFDLLLHAGITACAMGFMATSHAPVEMFPITMGTSLVILGLRRRFALKKRAEIGVTSGEMTAVRLEEIEQRLADLEAREARVAELEERLDFAERVLAKPEEPRKWIGEARAQ
jgi:hypothetical protein